MQHSLGDVFVLQGFGEARADALEGRREEAAAELLGKPEPRQRPPVREIAAKQRELDELDQAPATVAQVREVRGAISSLKAKLYAATGRKLI